MAAFACILNTIHPLAHLALPPCVGRFRLSYAHLLHFETVAGAMLLA